MESRFGIFLIFLRLGLTAFGGPIAHLGYFREEFVRKRRWISERGYADLVALCQFLPGPASSQVGLALGFSRGGYLGSLAAWAGFTLPSALILMGFASALSSHSLEFPVGVIHGLKVVAVAVVAQAVWEMAKTLCRGVSRMGIMALAASVAFLIPTSLGHLGVIALAGVSGSILFKPEAAQPDELQPMRISPGAGILFLSVFFVILSGLPFLAVQFPNRMIEGIEAFYRSGALVFGGGHVVLPGLQASVLAKGFVDPDTFLAGYGAAQAVPGPLFSFAAFLGASMKTGLSAWAGGLLCLSAIFAPSFLLVFGSLPFWEQWRRNGRARAAMTGIHAAVVGILLAAWCRPVCTSALRNPFDFITALLAFLALVFWRVPPWLVVFACGSLGLFLDEPLTPP